MQSGQRKLRRLLFVGLFASLCCLCLRASASDMRALDNEALADVVGRDGLSFLAALNTSVPSSTLGFSDTAGNPATLNINNLNVTGIVAGTSDVISGTAGNQDYVSFTFPVIPGANSLQLSYDMAVTANGSTFGSSVMLQNLAFGGSATQWSPAAGGGVNFGLDLNVSIDALLLQPNGIGNASGALSLSGIRVGAAGAPGQPWTIADIVAQPGFFNTNIDASGTSNIQIGVNWPTSGAAPSGSLQIDNISFATPSGSVNLGSSSIGSMQIQYLNIKIK